MKVAFIGDIGFFGKYSMEGNTSIFDYFSSAAKYLSQFDYVIGNLELPFLEHGQSIGAKSAYLKSLPSNVALLKYLNINIVTLANNHIFDFGDKGVESTISLLEQNGIKYFGIYEKDILLEDVKLALHGYCCYSTNPYGLNGHVNKLNLPDVEAKLRKYHELGYLNIVSIHAGLEHVNYPARHDIKMARQLGDISPYIYFGHHPHVLQGIESYKDSLIAYSLGNFCFDDVYTPKSLKPLVEQNNNNKTSAILELNINNGKLENHQTTSLFMGENTLEIDSINLEPILLKYSKALLTDEVEYNIFRNNLFSKYVSNRKSMRDIQWYIKRMNYRSVLMIIRAKYNQWQHKRNVLRHVDANPN